MGAALGEFIGDLLEGYEIDDPFGFVAYVVAFTVAVYVVGGRPLGRVRFVVAALVAGMVQAAIEVIPVLVIGGESPSVAAESFVGNSVAHGLVGGALPLVFAVPVFHAMIDGSLCYAPKGSEQPQLRDLERCAGQASDDGATGLDVGSKESAIVLTDFSFAYPDADALALRRVSFAVDRGEVVGVKRGCPDRRPAGVRVARWAAIFISLFASMSIDEMEDGIRGVGLPAVVANALGYAFRLLYNSLSDLFRIIDHLRQKGIDLGGGNPIRLAARLRTVLVPAVVFVVKRDRLDAGGTADAWLLGHPRQPSRHDAWWHRSRRGAVRGGRRDRCGCRSRCVLGGHQARPWMTAHAV